MGLAQPVTARRPLLFRTPGGWTIRARPVAIDPDPEAYNLTIEVTADDYAELVSASLFHLSPAGRGPQAGRFRPSGCVRIDLAPHRDVLDPLLLLGTDAAEIVASVARAAEQDPPSPLLATESWFALSVVTEVQLPPDAEGILREGYRTVWSVGAVGGGSAMLATIARHLALNDTGVHELADAPGIEWTTVTDAGSWRTVALADDDTGRVAVYSMLSSSVERERFPEIALLIAHLNSGLIVGNWELDTSSGEICVKTSIDVGDEPLSEGLVARLLHRNRQVTEGGLAVVGMVANGEASVEDAIRGASAQRG